MLAMPKRSGNDAKVRVGIAAACVVVGAASFVFAAFGGGGGLSVAGGCLLLLGAAVSVIEIYRPDAWWTRPVRMKRRR